MEGVGYELAPNLATFQFRGAEAILQNIIEPNREVNPLYLNYSILTSDDRIVNGMISNESAASITLLRGENLSETIQRSDIAEMKSSKMSLMPEGLENQVDLQGMADLIAYLTATN
jgi:putative heme-binding domain-containing protein